MRGGGSRRPADAPRNRLSAERSLRLTWRLFAGALSAIAAITIVRVVADGPKPVDAALVALIAAAAALAAWNRQAVHELEAGRRTEAESFARILRGLSRSVSPDAIVSAIVGELGEATGADHVVVVQRRPQGRGLEATLVSTRPGIPSATSLLPLGGLDDEPLDRREREAVMNEASPIEPVPVVTANAVALGRGPAVVRRAGVGVAAGHGESLADRRERPTPSEDRGTGAPWGSRADRAATRRAAERIAARAGRAFGLTHMLAEPLVTDGRVVGALVLSRRVRVDWSPSARRILAAAATEASAALERAYSHREAAAAASTDALTGLPNRRYFDEFCGLVARRRRAEDAVGVLMIDIDRFKQLNDRYGHATGDQVLRAVASAIGRTVREADVPARYGGEEFVVLLRNPSRRVALEVAERVRAAVRGLDAGDAGVPAVSVSVGVAVADLPDEPIEHVVERADRALYRAKRAGRDRVVAG